MNPTWLFVGSVYAIAISIARRARVDIPARVALLFYLLVVGYLLEPMTGRSVNVHADVLETIPPWSFLIRDRFALNPGMNDVPLQMVPWAHAARESWKSLRAPIWNPTTGCGMPLLGNGQSAALSPLRLIALPLDLGHSMTAEAAMKLLIALTFMYLYCRRRWSEWASLIAAVIFAFSGFMFSWLHFPHATTACFFPAVLYFVDLLAERPTFARCTAAAVVGASIVFGGQPEIAAHIFLVALLYLLWLRPPLKNVAAMAGAVVIATLLAAPHLGTFAETVTRSERFTSLQRYSHADAELPFSDYLSAALTLLPRYFGPIRKAWGPAEPDAVTGFAGALAIAAWFAVAWYLVATKRWRSAEAFFVLLALLVFGAIFEWPGFTDIFHILIPFGAHSRLRHALLVALAILAAAAIDHSRERRAPLLFGLGITAAVLVTIFIGIQFPLVVRRRLPTAILLAIPAVVVIIAAAVSVFRRKSAALALLFCAVVLEMWTGGRWFNHPTPQTLMYPRTTLITKLGQMQKSAAQPFRIVSWGPMLFQNIPAIYGLEDVRVHDPMASSRYLDFVAKTSDFDPDYYFAGWVDTKTHMLDFLNVRYLVTDPGVIIEDRTRYVLLYEGPDGRIFENTTFLPRFYAARNVVAEYRNTAFTQRLREMDDKWAHTALLDSIELENRQMHDDFFTPRPEDAPEARVSIVKSAATEYRLNTTAPRYTLVVSSIPWWPGWKIERNGQRVEPIRVNGAFLGFAVPKGEMDVRVWYDPWTWKLGVILALTTVVALIGIGLSGSRVVGLSGTRQPDNPTT